MTKTITAMFGIAVFAAVLFGSAAFAPQAFAGADPPAPNEAGKVVICHNGDDGPETIEVSGNAVDKHLEKHGDSLGECVEEEPDCSVSPDPLEITFETPEPQNLTTGVGCINDQPNGLGAEPISTNCGEFGISIALPTPFQSFITPDAYGVDFEFMVQPFNPAEPEIECFIEWQTDSVANGIEQHIQTVLISFPPV